jgi:hypothetical protein
MVMFSLKRLAAVQLRPGRHVVKHLQVSYFAPWLQNSKLLYRVAFVEGNHRPSRIRSFFVPNSALKRRAVVKDVVFAYLISNM